jgi:drug/metabolite transporter (DMT)-like permease
MGEHTDAITLTAFGAMVLFAGANAVAIRFISCETCELDPMWSAALRFLLAMLVFLVIARALKAERPRGRALTGAVLYGVLTFGAGFGLIYLGLERAPAGIGGVLLATGPLLTFFAAVAHRQERFRWDGLAGALIALAGTAVMFLSGLDVGIPASALAAIVAGSACWAEAAVVVKMFPPVHPAARNAIGMAAGSAILLLLIPVLDNEVALPTSPDAWLALGYLVTLGSVGVFGLYLYVLHRWTASAISYEFVLIPIVNVLFGAWLLDERITASFVAGAALILAGVYVGALRRARPVAVVSGVHDEPAR